MDTAYLSSRVIVTEELNMESRHRAEELKTSQLQKAPQEYFRMARESAREEARRQVVAERGMKAAKGEQKLR